MNKPKSQTVKSPRLRRLLDTVDRWPVYAVNWLPSWDKQLSNWSNFNHFLIKMQPNRSQTHCEYMGCMFPDRQKRYALRVDIGLAPVLHDLHNLQW